MATIFEKASLVLTHGVGYKVGALYAQYPYADTAKFSLTRSSSSYRTTSCGVEEIVTNEPRIDFEDGIPHLSIQDTCQNLIVYSDLSNWNLNRVNRSLDSGISPAGKINATKVTVSQDYGENTILISNGSGSGTYTYSIYAKEAGNRYLMIQIWTGSNDTDICYMFDLEQGVAAANTTTYPNNGTPQISSIGDGWYRISVNGTIATTSSLTTYLYTTNSTGYLSNSSRNGLGFYAYGAQLEKHHVAGFLPSALAYSSGSYVTTSRDENVVGNFTPSSRRVTVYGHIRLRPETSTEEGSFNIFGFVNGSTNQYGIYFWGNDNNKFGFNSWNGDSYGISNSTINDGNWHKVVGVFDFDDFTKNELYIDGVKQSISQTRGTTLQRSAAPFSLSSPSSIDQDPKCDYREVMVFDQELTDAECITLST